MFEKRNYEGLTHEINMEKNLFISSLLISVSKLLLWKYLF